MNRGVRRPAAGRLSAVTSAVAVTLVSVLGSAGMLPSAVDPVTRPAAPSAPSAPSAERSAGAPAVGPGAPVPSRSERLERRAPRSVPVPPDDSGEGRRVVFDESDQRVWLVRADGSVRRTYPVSGSLYDNLDPGTYAVFSRSEQAWGYDDTGTMEWFVRFTQTESGGNIGFHDIPVDDGRPVQTVAQLGTPRSHGCIRQAEPDARALWAFAPIGTTVVVTA